MIYKDIKGELGIYVSLNGTTLSFYDNEEDAYNNKESEEHYYGNIAKQVFKDKQDIPWQDVLETIEKVVIVDEIEPTNTACYFLGMHNLKQIDNIERIDTRNVTDMNNMFSECKSLTKLNLSEFNTSNVTKMKNMFASCESLEELDLENFDTSQVTDMGGMFEYNNNLISVNLTSFDTSKVTSMYEMFTVCWKLKELDLTSFDTSKVVNMQKMFNYCWKLTSILVGPKWKEAEDNAYMFGGGCGTGQVTVKN